VLGETIAAYLHHGGPHPAARLERIYPRFYFKQMLRLSYERLAPDWLLDFALTNPLFTTMANTVFFRKKKLK
jgi:hypothetical protein